MSKTKEVSVHAPIDVANLPTLGERRIGYDLSIEPKTLIDYIKQQGVLLINQIGTLVDESGITADEKVWYVDQSQRSVELAISWAEKAAKYPH